MTGQMCWLSTTDFETKILHIRSNPFQPWQLYTTSHLAVPDPQIPGISKGIATYQILFSAGWELVATKDAYKLAVVPSRREAA
jgi:hypothetical protein